MREMKVSSEKLKISKLKTRVISGIFAFALVLSGGFLVVNNFSLAFAAGETCEAKSGTHDGVDWEITTDCQLILGKAGQTQTLTKYINRSANSYPWNNDRANIKTATFAGQVIGQGSLNYMFNGMTKLTNIKNINNLNSSNVTNMANMFRHTALSSLDLSNFDTSNVTSMAWMFADTPNLTSLNISGFDTSNVDKMTGMFARSGLPSLDVSNFNTSKVTIMADMFKGMPNIKSLDLSSFNTANVTDMRIMFKDMSSLTSLNISSFDTSNVARMNEMFNGVSSLTSLDLSNFSTSSIANMTDMFLDTDNLSSITFGSSWTKWVDNAHLMTPPTNTTTGKWIRTDKFLPSKTPAELYAELPANISTYAGTWIWEVLPQTPQAPTPKDPELKEIEFTSVYKEALANTGMNMLFVALGAGALTLAGTLLGVKRKLTK